MAHDRQSGDSKSGDRELGKNMAKAAAIGAVIAIPVPFVGPVIGAVAGAGFAYYRSRRKAVT